MNLGDLATLVGGKVGLSDAASLTLWKAYAKQRYHALCAGALWKDLLTVYTFAVAANQNTIILPHQVAQFVGAKYDTTGLIPVDQAWIFASNPELWEQVGAVTHCSELAAIATKVMPLAAGEALKLKSSNAGDVSLVTIHGEDTNGDAQQEQIALNGLALVATVNSYAVVYGLSKAATVGTITVRNNADSATLLTLLPAETQRLHRRLRLHQVTGEALTLLVLGKRHPGPFSNDNDATGLPTPCDQALQAYVQGDALEKMRQYGKAQAKFAEALALEAKAKKDETYQAAQSKRLTPGDGMAEGCNPSDYL